MNDLTVDFFAYTMSPYPTDFNWDFGDGTTGNGQLLTHTYAEEGTYIVVLHSIDVTGCESTYEDTISVSIVGNYQSINEPSGLYITDVSEVYPNPVHSGSKINISLQTAAKIQIKVYNQVGQNVCNSTESLSMGTHKIPIGIDNLREGFYTLHIISDNNETIVRKFIKVQ